MTKDKIYTISVLRANLAAFLFSIPIIILSVLGYSLFWPLIDLFSAIDFILVWVILVVVFGVIFHEFLHGITWSLFAKNGWKSIQFGLKWSSLTPYCHCKEPLLKWHYTLGTAMPFIIMGVMPIVLSIILGNGVLLIIGILFGISAGGDILGLWMLRKANKEDWVQDHPSEIGFIIIGKLID
jgi:hypothetical protein